MATLGGGHRTRTLWQPLGAVTETRQIGDPDACPELYTTMIELRDTTKLLGRQGIRQEQYLGY